MKELNYLDMREKIINRLCTQRKIVLATSAGDKVTARTVYCVSHGLDIFFMTSKAYTKYKQIVSNPFVALCFDNYQIQGKAVILGHPKEIDNASLLSKCEYVDSSFRYPERYKNTILIKVEITEVEIWNNHGREYLDVKNEKSYRVG